MCGLFGAFGHGIVKKDLDFVYQLGIVSQLRGIDSSGIFQANTAGYHSNELLVKDACSFSELVPLYSIESKQLLRNIASTIVMGHVRATTKGADSIENSHPFNTEKYVISHNGTLADHKYNDPAKVKSDSFLLSEDIEKNGVEKVVSELNTNGSYAFSIYDKKSKRIIFINNGKRPLACAISNERSVLFWCSELDMLKYLAERANMKMNFFIFGPGKIYSTTLDKVKAKKYSIWDIRDIVKNKGTVPIKVKTEKEEKENKDVKLRFYETTCKVCRKAMSPIEKHFGKYDPSSAEFLCEQCVLKEEPLKNPGVCTSNLVQIH